MTTLPKKLTCGDFGPERIDFDNVDPRCRGMAAQGRCMSEPIKPALWRCACNRRPCLGLHMCRETPPRPLYTADDVIEFVRRALLLADVSIRDASDCAVEIYDLHRGDK